MLQIATSDDALEQVGDNPSRVPDLIAANPEEYGYPYDDMLSAIRHSVGFLERIANASEEARETPRPTQLNLPTANLVGAPANTGVVRYRTTRIVLSVTAACAVTLIVGSGNRFVFNFAGADTKDLPFIDIFDRGIDISITTSAGIANGYIVAFPE